MEQQYKEGQKVKVVLGDDQWRDGVIKTVFQLYGWSGETKYEVVSIAKPHFITVCSERCLRT